MAQLITEWQSTDPTIVRTLAMIAEFPEYSPERLELEASLHQWQAAQLLQEVGWRRAERAAQSRRRKK